jgi:hypothetical protein
VIVEIKPCSNVDHVGTRELISGELKFTLIQRCHKRNYNVAFLADLSSTALNLQLFDVPHAEKPNEKCSTAFTYITRSLGESASIYFTGDAMVGFKHHVLRECTENPNPVRP